MVLSNISLGHQIQYPISKRSCLDASVPLPRDASDSIWDDTLCELPSVHDLFLSYAELRDRARAGDTTIRGLLNFCCSKFGDDGVEQLKKNGYCSKGGYDLGAWLRRNGWNIAEMNSGSTFRRVSKAATASGKGGGKGP